MDITMKIILADTMWVGDHYNDIALYNKLSLARLLEIEDNENSKKTTKCNQNIRRKWTVEEKVNQLRKELFVWTIVEKTIKIFVNIIKL